MITCDRAEELLIYVESNDPCISAAERAAYFEHIACCDTCREEHEQGQFVREMIQRHARFSPETVELLEASGETVPAHLRPEPEEELVITDEQVEAALAKLMAKIDEIEALEAQYQAEPADSVRLKNRFFRTICG